MRESTRAGNTKTGHALLEEVKAHRTAADNMYAVVLDEERPKTRADCKDEPRPCPWVGCRHHLYLDVNPDLGSIKVNFPGKEPWELEHSCSLDAAEREGGMTLDLVSRLLNVTRERTRQIESRALPTLRAATRRLTR